jgi:F0F1-type ATP synthase epsilon subunit
LTPEQTVLEAGSVTQVQAHLADGGPIGVYPGHAPLLAETLTAPLRYVDAAGEHEIDLDAGILQVNGDGVTVFAGQAKPCEGLKPSQGSQNDQHFDQLAQELFTTLDAQPDGVLGNEKE